MFLSMVAQLIMLEMAGVTPIVTKKIAYESEVTVSNLETVMDFWIVIRHVV